MTDFLNYLIQEKTLQLLTANPQDARDWRMKSGWLRDCWQTNRRQRRWQRQQK